MKIWLFEISDFLPDIDGANRLYRMGMFSKVLATLGHDVTWWSSTFNHQLRKQRFNSSTTIELQPGFRLRLLYGPGYQKSVSVARLRHNHTVARSFMREAHNLSKSQLPDVMFTCIPTLEVSEQVARFGMENQIPVVVDVRELWPDNYLLYFPQACRPLLRLFLAREFMRVRTIMCQASVITGTSEAYVSWGLRIARRERTPTDRSFALGTYVRFPESLGVNLDISKFIQNANMKTGDLIFTYAGTFGHLYDFRTVVDVADRLARSGETRVKFVFAGSGGAQESFLRGAAEQRDNIHLTGWLEDNDVKRLLRLSSVGLAPYAPMAAAPTLPNKPFEYMAAGIPLLSSVEGELRAIVEDEGIGLHYKAGDVETLERKIRWFLDNPETLKKMGQKARTTLENRFNADTIYRELADHIEHILLEKGYMHG